MRKAERANERAHTVSIRARFLGQLKRERVYRATCPTFDAARADVFEYIERFHSGRMRRRIARQDLEFFALSQACVVSG